MVVSILFILCCYIIPVGMLYAMNKEKPNDRV